MLNEPITWRTDVWSRFLDPSPFMEVRDAWVSAVRRSFGQDHLPLSGDVTQFIRAWGELFAQVGFVNVNNTNSSDPELERRITTHYSYGKQLGRTVEAMASYLQAHQGELKDGPDAQKEGVDDFLAMAREISGLKKKRDS